MGRACSLWPRAVAAGSRSYTRVEARLPTLTPSPESLASSDQRMRRAVFDADGDEIADRCAGVREHCRLEVRGLAGEPAGAPARRPFDQNLDLATDHSSVDLGGDLLLQRDHRLQPTALLVFGNR